MKTTLKGIFQAYGTIVALFLMVGVFALSTDTFISPRNLINILSHISMLTIIAIGLTVCMVNGDFDMSISAVASLSGVVITSLLLQGFSLIPAVSLAVLVGIIFGLVAGFLVTTMKVSAFIAPLALGSVATGINFMYTRGQEVYGTFPDSFLFIAQGSLFGLVPTQVIVMGIVVIFFALLMEKSKMGKWMYAIGGSERAAYHSGIRVNYYRIVAMAISGALAAFTGCVLASRLGSGQPTAGEAFLLDAIAAAFLGMTTVKIGRPNVIGTSIGALIMGVIDNGLVLMGVSYFFQYIAKGVIIILAVGLTSFRSVVSLGERDSVFK